MRLPYNYEPRDYQLPILKALDGDYKRAIIAFEKAEELNPNNLSIINNLGVLYRETGFLDKAENFFHPVIA